MTTKGQHTPGPWVIVMGLSGHTSVYPIVDGEEIGKERVADVYCPLNIEGGHIGANARLIAAAPDMRVMIDRLVTLLAAFNDPDDMQTLEDARALLAKIEGKE